MAHCRNVCCCCSPKIGVLLGGVLAVFSSIYYFFMGFIGFVDIYATSTLIDATCMAAGLVCLACGIILLIGMQDKKEHFLMVFIMAYGVATCIRGVFLANSLVVCIKWAEKGWQESYYDEDGVLVEQKNNASACIFNVVFLFICLVADIWCVLATIVYRGNIMRVRRKRVSLDVEEVVKNFRTTATQMTPKPVRQKDKKSRTPLLDKKSKKREAGNDAPADFEA